MNDLDAIDADLTRYDNATGSDRAWEAAQLARHVRPLADEVRQLRGQLAEASGVAREVAR